ncbi:MAG: hypothetical protein ABR599_02555, partial [Gemmatimonadota bacterium]
RVIFFDDRFGPLFGPHRSKLLDGIAVRLRPGEEEELELRLLRFESGTLELPEGLLERVRRVAGAVVPDCMLAAFDGETLRLLPDPDADGEPIAAGTPSARAPAQAARPAPSPVVPVAGPPPAQRHGAPPGQAPSSRRGKRRAPEPSPPAPADERDRSRLDARPPGPPRPAPSRGRSAGAQARGASRRARAPKSDPPREDSRSPASRQPSGRGAPTLEPPAASVPPPDPASPADGQRRGRRRGKRGGRRR